MSRFVNYYQSARNIILQNALVVWFCFVSKKKICFKTRLVIEEPLHQNLSFFSAEVEVF